MVLDVNTNLWCGNTPAKCGENQATGVTGGGAVAAACTGRTANTISTGLHRRRSSDLADNGRPPIPTTTSPRATSSRQLRSDQVQGAVFNKANTRCGRYNYWSIEKNYYDNDRTSRSTAGSGTTSRREHQGQGDQGADQPGRRRRGAIRRDPARDMYFTRARDGAAPFPNKPYNVFCDQP
jgi:hypothetical protein